MNATRSHGAAPAAKKSSTSLAPGLDSDLPGVSGFVLALREQLRAGMKKLGDFSLGDLTVEVCVGSDSVWALIRRQGRGGLALRAVYVAAGNLSCHKAERSDDEALRLEIDSPVGRHVVAFRTSGADLHRLRMTVRLTPAAPLLIPFAPRDLYPLDSDDNPLGAKGKVEAAQRGMNSGLLYFRLDEPAFGSALYFQNLTAMNAYYRATDTKPDGAVGGEWPELGYLPPSPPQSGTPPTAPLPAGEDVVVSDAILVFRDWAADNEAEMARQFLQMLGVAYQELTPPAFEYRDWIWRAERTLTDLEKGSPAVVRHYGQSYVMPYLDAEYPDFMAQMSVIAALHDYGKWRGAPVGLEGKLKRGLGKFCDPAVGTTRRYLPNVGDDKDADAIDSWYFYHPLLNLGRLALDGDDEARELLLKSIDYGIRAARHFNYIWPITYDIKDFSIKTKTRDDGKFGQTDVNGIYAYVMIQLYELTDDDKYLREARAAIDAAIGKRFNLMYQANLTAWERRHASGYGGSPPSTSISRKATPISPAFSTIARSGNRRSATRSITIPSSARPACTMHPIWRFTNASIPSPHSNIIFPTAAPMSNPRLDCWSANIANIRSIVRGSIIPIFCRPMRWPINRAAVGSTATSPFRSRISTATASQPARWDRKFTVAGPHSSTRRARTIS